MVFKRKLLSSSIALAIAGQAAPLMAEEGSAMNNAQMEEVVVKGIRGSLQRSMDIKRDSMGVVDAISAEEMGKFPDANLAESLQRITGVSISRSRGEGSQVTVRGFGPEYNLVTLNGRQMPTHYGLSRSFDFGDLASEGVAGVQVYKTGRADVPSGGVGSTINISTPKPLEGNEVFNLAVKAVNDTSTREGDSITPEFSGIYMKRFNDDKFGIAIIASKQRRDNGVNSATTGGWFTQEGTSGSIVPNDVNQINRPTASGEFYSIPQSMAYNIAEFENDRVNSQVVLQWAATDAITTTLDYIRSEYTVERKYSDFSAWFSNTNALTQSSEWTMDGIHATPIYYTETLAYRDFAMGTGRDGSKNLNESVGLNVEWVLNDDLVLSLDHHDSSAKKGATGPNGTSSLITMASYEKVGQTLVTGYDMPVLILDLDSSGNQGDRPLYKSDMLISGSRFDNNASKMDIQQTKLSGQWNLTESSSIDFGAEATEISNRSVSSVVQLDNWNADLAPTELGDLNSILVRSSIEDQFDELSGLSHPGAQTEFFTASLADLQAVSEAGYAASGRDYAATGDCGTGYCASTDWNQDLRTTEESFAAFIRLNWSGEISGMPANLHTGVRYEETDIVSAQKSLQFDGTSWRASGEEVFVQPAVDASGDNVPEYRSFKGDYSFLLPSIDFDIEFAENVIARASFSETVTRPSYGDIKGGIAAGGPIQYRTNTPPALSAGDPTLVPIQSENIDLSIEWYYGSDSYFSVGYFEKEVDNFIGTLPQDVELFPEVTNVIGGQLWNQAIEEGGFTANQYSEIGAYIVANYSDNPAVVDGVIYSQAGDPTLLWTLTKPVNQKTASVDGIEVNLQHTLGDTGFGFVANATFANADVGYDTSKIGAGQFVLNGLSDSANLIGYYDKNGIQVRLAYNWRDDFLAGAGQGQGTNTNPTNVEAYGQLDLGITYEASENLTVYFSGQNITNETVHVYGLTKRQVLQAVQGGPRYDIGIRYTFQ
ncbi:TonB-dependent receptor [Pseudomonadales bacterium]|nr:TonB-dependent receptor [Pseudomonadales bacterium]